MPTKPKFQFSTTFWLLVCVVMFSGGRWWHLGHHPKSTRDVRDGVIDEQAATIESLNAELRQLQTAKCVVDVSDGDAVSIVANKELARVRIVGIDCPESNQPFGDKAKQFTNDFCLKKNVTLIGDEIDLDGRRLADVVVNNESLREALLSAGLAWHDTRTNNDPELAELQSEAKAAKRGLWKGDDAVPPWEWER